VCDNIQTQIRDDQREGCSRRAPKTKENHGDETVLKLPGVFLRGKGKGLWLFPILFVALVDFRWVRWRPVLFFRAARRPTSRTADKIVARIAVRLRLLIVGPPWFSQRSFGKRREGAYRALTAGYVLFVNPDLWSRGGMRLGVGVLIPRYFLRVIGGCCGNCELSPSRARRMCTVRWAGSRTF
jgi:hypothetical protein